MSQILTPADASMMLGHAIHHIEATAPLADSDRRWRGFDAVTDTTIDILSDARYRVIRSAFFCEGHGVDVSWKFSFLALALVLMFASTVSAQEHIATIFPADLGLAGDVDVERTVETDGDPSTTEIILSRYDTVPTRRAILQIRADGTSCVGPFENWFGDHIYVWPTYVTLGGLTRVVFTVPNTGAWAVLALDTPACR